MINPLDKQLEENGILFGKYRLLSKLAVGGMAELFLAKQAGIAGFSKTVVIKCILPFFSQKQDFVTMFLDEARIAAHLNHPNVVQIYDISEFEGIYYMAMEFIPGQNLKHVRKRLASQSRYKENMPYGLLAGIFAQAAAGLEHVHTASDDNNQPLHLVHRDISPNNLMLSYEGILKVVDFGVAKAKSQEHETEVGVLKGRLSYMSPEHLSAQPIDGRSDLFALGIVLYEMSTGKRLFKRRSEAETIQALLTTPIPPPSRIKPGYPKKLEDILLKVLQRNPSERYQSARAFRLALEEFMEEEGRYYGVRQLGDAMQQLFPNEIANEKKGIRPSPVTQQDLLNLARGSYRVMQDNHFYQGSYNSFHDNASPNPTQPQTSPTQTMQPKGPATASLGSPFAMPPQQKMPTASYNPPGQVLYQDEDATSITGEATQVGHTTEEIDEKTQIEVQVASADGLQAVQPVAPPMPGKKTPEQTRPLHPPISPELVDEPEEPPKKRGLLIILVALFFLGAGGGGAYWVINYMPSSQPPISERREEPPPRKTPSFEDQKQNVLTPLQGRQFFKAANALEVLKQHPQASEHKTWLEQTQTHIDQGMQLELAQKLYQQGRVEESQKVFGKLTKQLPIEALTKRFPQAVPLQKLLSQVKAKQPTRRPPPRRVKKTRPKRRRTRPRRRYRRRKVTLPVKLYVKVYTNRGGKRRMTNELPRLMRNIERKAAQELRRSVRGITRPWFRFVKQRFSRSRRQKFVFYPRAAVYVIRRGIKRGDSKSKVANTLVSYQKRYRFRRYRNK